MLSIHRAIPPRPATGSAASGHLAGRASRLAMDRLAGKGGVPSIVQSVSQ